jgi:hypothetical protein
MTTIAPREDRIVKSGNTIFPNLVPLGVAQSLDLQSQAGVLDIDNATLANNAGGNSGQHLVLNINNTTYKIKLESN